MLRKNLPDGILAGIMIAIGGSVFFACDNRYCGAVLFSVALLSICLFGFSLYTGKIGFLVMSHGKNDILAVCYGLLGNLIATVVCGLALAYALPHLHDAAVTACNNRLSQLPLQTFIRGIFCGVLMYAAVLAYREKKTLAGIFFCVPVFILAGFEHSIADMFYFALALNFSGEAIVFLLLVILGNTLGGMLIPLLQLTKGRSNL